jgi:hypothetical protein
MGLAANFLCLAAGIYAGMYADQNYDLPRLPSVQQLGATIKEYFESIRKEK